MQTPFQITFKNMPPSAFLEAHVRNRALRLEHLRRDVVFCRVVIEAPNHSQSAKAPIAIAIEVDVPGRTLIAKGVDQRHDAKHDGLAVVNRAFDAIERQLEDDIKTKRRRAHGEKRNGNVRADT